MIHVLSIPSEILHVHRFSGPLSKSSVQEINSVVRYYVQGSLSLPVVGTDIPVFIDPWSDTYRYSRLQYPGYLAGTVWFPLRDCSPAKFLVPAGRVERRNGAMFVCTGNASRFTAHGLRTSELLPHNFRLTIVHLDTSRKQFPFGSRSVPPHPLSQ